jgi:hypothetical protein
MPIKYYFKIILFVFLSVLLMDCTSHPEQKQKNNIYSPSIVGTWELVTGTIIENGDTSVTDYTRNVCFIKIINDTHFTFLNHDLNKGADSTAVFVAGGGKYSLNGNAYKENLEYCNFREWEGNDFEFEITIKNDTLTQRGLEKIEDLNVERLNIEIYKRVN